MPEEIRNCQYCNNPFIYNYRPSAGERRGRFCGKHCARKSGNVIHGNARNKHPTRTYNSWSGMIQRCCNENHPRYKDYGARGISVCQAWRESFQKFLMDMGECPPDKSIERRNNNKGYTKNNCYWASTKEQARNTRKNIITATYLGKTLMLKDWSEIYKINYLTLYHRIKRGWSIHRALTTDPSMYHGNG